MLKTDTQVSREFTDKVYSLMNDMRAMADQACESRDVETIYYLLGQERKLHYMLRTMEMRNIIKRP